MPLCENLGYRLIIDDLDFEMQEVAKEMGIAPESFSRALNRNLEDDYKIKILRSIMRVYYKKQREDIDD